MNLTEHELFQYLTGAEDEALFQAADRKRAERFGDEVFVRGIIEFSNRCNKRCRYCGLRSANRDIRRYRMDEGQILEAVGEVAEHAGTVVLQSGDDFGYSARQIGDLIKDIKANFNVAVTLSLGDRGLVEYEYWRACGADRCLLKLETTSVPLYKSIREGEDFRERLHRIHCLQGMGYEVGSGVITGLPGTGHVDLVRDILFLTELDLDMIAVGPFVPHQDTPFDGQKPGSVDECHRVNALLRLLNPHANIPATSALDALSPHGREQGLKCGCNVIMPSLTPEAFRRDYFIYPGKNSVPGRSALTHARNVIEDAGFVASMSQGFSRRESHVNQTPQRDAAGHHACGAA